MATLIPEYSQIIIQKVQPTEGELHLLNFLDAHLDKSFEVYFNPFMNGDRPDIVLMRKGFGVMIIEVKDYHLQYYKLDEKKNFVIKSSNTKTFSSPINQVLKYKDNLFELHIDKLLEKKIRDIRNFKIVSSAVYFHNANFSQIEEMLVKPFEHDNNYQTFLKYNIDLLGYDNLNELDFEKILKLRYLKAAKISFLFTDDIYESFKRFLKPPFHLKEDGKEINYSKKQRKIIYESKKKEQRIKGVVGSGKTTILAARAVQAHKRTGSKVLILTYNITLKNYIKDKISDVRENFAWENFIILNYHLFIKSELNNLGISFGIPDDFNKFDNDKKEDFFEKFYYSNKSLFLERKQDIKTYDVILIDEVQDYKRAWLEIIKECFLTKNGEYVVFGDVKQNIYNNITNGKDVSVNVVGTTSLKYCFRSDYKVKDLAIEFQKQIFKEKYEIDDFNIRQNNLELDFGRNQQGNINYIFLENTDTVNSLYTIIYQNAINKNISPSDITILGHSITLLKKFDAFYRHSSKEKTNTIFESFETVFRMGLNYVGNNNQPIWLKDGIALIKRDNDSHPRKAFDQLSILFTVYELHEEYPSKFNDRLEYFCLKFKTTSENYKVYRQKHQVEISNFIKEFGPNRQASILKVIRNNKKIHFHAKSGTVKISTIHSFKGWESDTLFLIIEKKFSKMQLTFDEILYTGITRSKSNLIMINFGNLEYHLKLKELFGTSNK
jgi:hypothetical protein